MSWHMYHYGSPTPKPLYAFCNSHHIGKLNMGKLTGWTQIKKVLKEQGKVKHLIVKYKDSTGKQRYKGSNHLRGSEWGSYSLEIKVVYNACNQVKILNPGLKTAL